MGHIDVRGKLYGSGRSLPCISNEVAPTINAHAWMRRGDWLGKSGQLDAAVKCFATALRSITDRQEVDERFLESDLSSAVAYHEIIEKVRVGESVPGISVRSGAMLYMRAKLRPAFEQYRHAARLDPHLEEAWIGCGRVLMEFGREKKACHHFDRGIWACPFCAHAWSERGEALRRLGKIDKAERSFRLATGLEDLAPAWQGLAWIEERKRRHHEKACHYYKRALEADPSYCDAYHGLARALRACGYYESSVRQYDRALELDDDPRLWVGRGLALKQIGSAKEALESMKRALEIDDECALAWYNAGCIQAGMGRRSEAEKSIERAGAISPIYAGPNAWTLPNSKGGGKN